MGRKKHESRTPGVGCGYLVTMATVTGLLMIANSYLVGLIVEANWSKIPEFFRDVRLFQASQIFVPMLLVIIQFVIYDRIRDLMMSRTATTLDSPRHERGDSS